MLEPLGFGGVFDDTSEGNELCGANHSSDVASTTSAMSSRQRSCRPGIFTCLHRNPHELESQALFDVSPGMIRVNSSDSLCNEFQHILDCNSVHTVPLVTGRAVSLKAISNSRQTYASIRRREQSWSTPASRRSSLRSSQRVRASSPRQDYASSPARLWVK